MAPSSTNSQQTSGTVAEGYYNLPPTVESIRQGWIASSQATAVVTALFASVEVGILAILTANAQGNQFSASPSDPTTSNYTLTITDESKLPDGSADIALRFFVYIGLVFNLGATFSSMIMLDCLGSLPVRAWRKVSEAPNAPNAAISISHDQTDNKILRAYGMDQRFFFSKMHAAWCLFLGSICLTVQIGIYLWQTEGKDNSIAAVMMPILAWGGLVPIFHFVFYSILCG